LLRGTFLDLLKPTQPRKPNLMNLPRFLAVILGLVLVPNFSQAASGTWSATATTGVWNTSANWNPGSVPGTATTPSTSANTDIATFSFSSSITSITNNAGRSLGGFLFDTENASAYNLASTANRYFMTRGMTSQITSTVTNSQTISGRIWIAEGIIPGGSDTYTLRNDADLSSVIFTLGVITNASAVTSTALVLRGSNTGSNAVTGEIGQTNAASSLSLVKEDAGTWILRAANTYSGGTIINAGMLAISNSSALGTGTVTINGGTLANAAGSGRTILNNVVFGGNAALGGAPGGASLTINGTTDLGGATRTITMSNSVTFAGVVANGGLVVEASAANRRLTLATDNTYSGGTVMAGGVLLVNNTNGSGTGSGAVTVASNAVIGGSGIIGGDLVLSDGALFAFDTSYTLTLNGLLTIAPTFGVSSLRTTSGGNIEWSSIVDGAYTLLETDFVFDDLNIGNFGPDNAQDIGEGRQAYFSSGSLVLNVIPEPSTYALLALAASALGARLVRRRR
jgi:autotransporter-associated beta strand protein